MARLPYNVEGASGGHTWRQPSALPPQPLPTQQALRAAQRALWGHARRLGYLTGQRGLTRGQIRRYGLGYDDGYLLPVYDEAGDLLTVVRHRPWKQRCRYDVPNGSQAALYPSVPHGEAVILTAGMFDALIGRRYGLPTVTTTCGVRMPHELAARFSAKRVAVVFDVGEEDEADEVVARLPCEAWPVRLPLPEGGDLSDWFVGHKRTRRELLMLVREASHVAL